MRDTTKLFNYTFGKKTVKVYDLQTKRLISSNIEIDGTFNAPGSVCMNPSCFYLAGINDKSRSTYMLHLPSFEVTKKADLIAVRCGHAIIKYKNDVYAFAGYDGKLIKTCEFYNINNDTWTEIPDMPKASRLCNAVIIKKRIFISGYDLATVFAFSPENQTYDDLQLSCMGNPKFMFSLGNRIYLQKNADEAIVCDENGTLQSHFKAPTLELGIHGGMVFYEGTVYFTIVGAEDAYYYFDLTMNKIKKIGYLQPSSFEEEDEPF